ncbi:hypothetical protein [Yoonia vestfoldensis]|nr:hypothetical protein [Yoonia vestfoldensis]
MMQFKNITATGAIGFCLSVMPAVSHAQSNHAAAQDEALFVPMVDECVAMPSAETCGRVRAVIIECAEELERALCDVLFTQPSAVFDRPQMQAEAQILLSATRDAIADIAFAEIETPENDGIIAESRADAEREMLRGDANPMSHSGPPAVVAP